MDVVSIARQLGAAIQKDERYTAYQAAKDAFVGDPELAALNQKMEELRVQYSEEASKPEPDSELLQSLDTKFQGLYSDIMNTKVSNDYNIARQDLDGMLNHLTQIIYLSANGEDPETCEPQSADCGGDCGSCGCGGSCGSCQ